MSPLQTGPLRGYSDWQRIGNYDEGVIVNIATPGTNATVISGPFDVSRYAYIGGTIAEQASTSLLTITWFADQAATVQVGQRFIVLSSQIPTRAQIRVPNLGPFVRFSSSAVAGANFRQLLILFGTNRVHPLEFIPVNPRLMAALNANIPANGTVAFFPSDYYAGPMAVWMFNNATCQITLFRVASAGPDEFLDQLTPSATGTETRAMMIAPAGAWYLSLFNSTAGATTVDLAATHSTTGSA